MPSTVSSFKSDHHIVFGVALAAVGVFGIIGSLTGNLAVMLAALFDPSALVDASSGGGSNAPAIPGAPPDDAVPEDPTTPTDPTSSPPAIEPPATPALPWWEQIPSDLSKIPELG